MILKTKNLAKGFDDFKLRDINLSLRKGELFGCIGPNGAGKSTLVKLLTAQMMPDSGNALIFNKDVSKNPVHAKAKTGIVPEQESPPSFLTVYEYLQFICKVRGIKNMDRYINDWLDFFEYKEDKNNQIKDLSRGTKQKVIATQAFIHKPQLVFIDEPLINLDPVMQKKFKSFLRDYVKKGNTIFLSTHVLSIAEELCTDIGIINKGRFILQDKVKNIRNKRKNLEDYFLEVISNDTD
ncbi:MAG: ABC transporter ATP-binding protein [Nanobdellota archaeon]